MHIYIYTYKYNYNNSEFKKSTTTKLLSRCFKTFNSFASVNYLASFQTNLYFTRFIHLKKKPQVFETPLLILRENFIFCLFVCLIPPTNLFGV